MGGWAEQPPCRDLEMPLRVTELNFAVSKFTLSLSLSPQASRNGDLVAFGGVGR